MDMKFVFVLLVLLVSTLLVEGRRGGGNGRGRGGSRGSRNREEGTKYTWSRDLGNGVTVEESAFAPTQRNEVLLKSLDSGLAAAGYTKSIVKYYYTANTPKIAVSLPDKGKRSPCYIVDTDLSYESVIALIASRNGSVVGLGDEVSLDGTRTPENALRTACKSGKLVRTTTQQGEPSENSEVLKVLTLDSVINLRIPTTQRSRGSGRAGGNRGGRRNN